VPCIRSPAPAKEQLCFHISHKISTEAELPFMKKFAGKAMGEEGEMGRLQA